MIARAICWTLVHSLWEGMLAALLAGIVVLCTRKSRPAMRHNLFAAILLLFLGVAGVTFWWQFQQTAASSAAVGATGWISTLSRTARTTTVRELSPARPGSYEQTAQVSTAMQRLDDAVNKHATTVALLYLVFLALQLIRMGAGLYQISRIRRHGIVPSKTVCVDKVTAMAAQLGIKRRISLIQSGSVGMPAVIGFLKPAILLPLGTLANLPPDQVEAILLHELAHIKRSDFLTNLLLHLAEIVFFFNPGIRWLCSLIRRERETCCDDIVLKEVPDKAIYFEALLAFQEYAAGGRMLTPQLTGGKNDLLWRMKRMLCEENKKLQLMEKTFLSFGLVALLAVGLLGMKTGDEQTLKTADKQTPQLAALHPIAVFSPKMDTIPDTSLQVKPLPAKKSRFPIISMNTDKKGEGNLITLKAIDLDGNKYFMQKLNNKITKISINGKAIPQEECDGYSYLFDEIEDEATANASSMQARLSARHVAAAARPTAPAAPVVPRPPLYDYFAHVIRDLLADGLIQSEDRLSFTLDNDGLVVNDTKQPDSVYQKYKAKYLKGPADHVIYTREGGHYHTDVWMYDGY